MIKANELRVGNYLLFHGHPAPVRGGYIQMLDNLDKYKAQLPEALPIPLSVEVLEKCGLYKSKNAKDEVVFHIMNQNGITADYTIEYWDVRNEFHIAGLKHKRIEYLHQLQNLFFELTGEELTVNL